VVEAVVQPVSRETVNQILQQQAIYVGQMVLARQFVIHKDIVKMVAQLKAIPVMQVLLAWAVHATQKVLAVFQIHSRASNVAEAWSVMQETLAALMGQALTGGPAVLVMTEQPKFVKTFIF
jgi:hypothetical protein